MRSRSTSALGQPSVGEDEADPRHQTISYVSPLARALTGKSVGDVVQMGGHDIEILAIA